MLTLDQEIFTVIFMFFAAIKHKLRAYYLVDVNTSCM